MSETTVRKNLGDLTEIDYKSLDANDIALIRDVSASTQFKLSLAGLKNLNDLLSFGTCSTVSDTQNLTVDVPSITVAKNNGITIPEKGMCIKILFENGYTCSKSVPATGEKTVSKDNAPTLSVSGLTSIPIKVGDDYAGKGFVSNGEIHELICDGSNWIDNNGKALFSKIIGDNIVPISNGGTGASSQADSLKNLLGSSIIPVNNGGTGASSLEDALTSLLGDRIIPTKNGGTGNNQGYIESVEKLLNARQIEGVPFNGTSNVTHFASETTTSGSTIAKTATGTDTLDYSANPVIEVMMTYAQLYDNRTLVSGSTVTYQNTILEANALTLSYNGGTAYPIKGGRGEYLGIGAWGAGELLRFRFIGTASSGYWYCENITAIMQGGDATNGYYTKYRDGKIVQRGFVVTNTTSISLMISMSDADYFVCASNKSSSGYDGVMYQYYNPTATSFSTRMKFGAGGQYNYWEATATNIAAWIAIGN